MKLSTSTNIVFERPDKSIMPMEEMMELAFAAGFDTFDISFYDWSLPHSPFLTDQWEKWLARIERKKGRAGRFLRPVPRLHLQFLRADDGR